jgi:DNA-binding NarL/FixJ family response regulator
MQPNSSTCAILADRQSEIAERVRSLLETTYETVYLVADVVTLREGASRLLPALIVLDLALGGRDVTRVLHDISELSPLTQVLVLTVHDDPSVARMALQGGAHGVVLKRCIGNDFLAAVDTLQNGAQYVSPDIGEIPLAE